MIGRPLQWPMLEQVFSDFFEPLCTLHPSTLHPRDTPLRSITAIIGDEHRPSKVLDKCQGCSDRWVASGSCSRLSCMYLLDNS
jgi:hypothetical protein